MKEIFPVIMDNHKVEIPYGEFKAKRLNRFFKKKLISKAECDGDKKCIKISYRFNYKQYCSQR